MTYLSNCLTLAVMPPTDDPILDAARLLSERDPGWTMTTLARKAGTSRATLYRRFPSRDAVVTALTRTGEAPIDLRTRVLDAFERAAARRGVAGTTVAHVAAEAGCSVATVYRHFDGREGLLSAYAATRTPRALLDELALDPSRPLHELLQVFASQAVAHLAADRATIELAFTPDPEVRPIVTHLLDLEAEGRAQLTAWLASRVDAGELRGDAAVLARAFIGVIASSVLARPANDASAPADEVAGIVDLFLHGCVVGPVAS